MFAEYYNTLDPVALRITDSIRIHWYGIAYVLAFLVTYLGMRHLARKKIGVMEERELPDFITYIAIFGVMLGGRLGYMLLYTPGEFFADPVSFFHLQKGGMASHGGIAGIVIFTLYWALTRKKSWPGIGDNLVVFAPLGLFLGRVANFVNGELYGVPVAADSPVAVRFATELRDLAQLEPMKFAAITEKLPATHPLPKDGDQVEHCLAVIRENPSYAASVREFFTPRHPSQLYEAALEGLALFFILYVLRRAFPKMRHGILTGLFFLLYAAFRMYVEKYYRVGDPWKYGISKGFFYSTFMIGIGLAFLAYAAFWGKTTAPHASRGEVGGKS